jgi:hypothetical protein
MSSIASRSAVSPLQSFHRPATADNLVVKPGHSYAGRSYNEWANAWWQWTFATPAPGHPETDRTGALAAVGQDPSSPVFFLTGTGGDLGTTPTTREITVPRGKAIFFNVLTHECSTLEEGPDGISDPSKGEACATRNRTQNIRVSIDGKPVTDPSRFRVDGPVFDFSVPDDNIIEAWYGGTVNYPAGTTGKSYQNGTWLMVKPLPPGRHKIEWYGERVQDDGSVHVMDLKYHVNVR